MVSRLHFDLASKLGILLQQKQYTISVAESCTGGLIGAVLTELPGTSFFFRGGVIAYSNEIKEKYLHVPGTILEQYGAVSAQTVRAMAEGVAQGMDTECAISISGIAGPSGGTPEKPIGLVYMGFVTPADKWERRYIFSGDRQKVREQSVEQALLNIIDSLAE
ncbi:MAG: CinA family protein [Chitinivibrionales bacterium]